MCHLSNKLSLSLGALLIGQVCIAHAEKADRDKPLHIESDRMSLDNANHVSIFEGKVDLTQGTLHVMAEKIVVTEDATGHKFCVATGHLASFRQKRDQVNEYVEGYAERLEYNTVSEKIDLFIRARVKREQDDVRGDHITYSTQTEVFRVNSPENTGRVRATLQPANKDAKTPDTKTPDTKPKAPATTPVAGSAKVVGHKAAQSGVIEANPDEPKKVEIKAVEPNVAETKAGEIKLVEPVKSEPTPMPKQPGN